MDRQSRHNLSTFTIHELLIVGKQAEGKSEALRKMTIDVKQKCLSSM